MEKICKMFLMAMISMLIMPFTLAADMTPTLQAVTEQGSETTNDVSIEGNLYISRVGLSQVTYVDGGVVQNNPNILACECDTHWGSINCCYGEEGGQTPGCVYPNEQFVSTDVGESCSDSFETQGGPMWIIFEKDLSKSMVEVDSGLNIDGDTKVTGNLHLSINSQNNEDLLTLKNDFETQGEYVGILFTNGRGFTSRIAGLPNQDGKGMLAFYTEAGKAMQIDNNGNVEVNGNIEVTSGNDVCIYGGNCLSSVSGSLWSKNSNKIYYNSGKVGIGTSNPNADLEIKRTGNSILTLTSTGDTYVGSNLFLVDSGNAASAVIKFDYTGSAATDREMYIGYIQNTKFSFYDGDHIMTIDNDDNVGIGTTDPDVKLHIYGGDIRVTATDANGADVRAIDNTGKGIDLAAQDGQGYIKTDTSGMDLILGAGYWGWDGVSHNRQLVLQSGGNVGIGTPSPESKLDVEGDVQIKGAKIIVDEEDFIIRLP